MQVLVVHAHPSPESFSRAIVVAAVEGLVAGGHHTDLLDLYAEGFAPAMSEAERRSYESPEPILDPAVRRSADLVRAAEAVVFVYPTWWWGLPAMLKGWLDRVLVPGVAFTLPEGKPPQPALTNVRRLVGISTYGSSWAYTRFFHDAGRRTVARTLRLVCHPRTRVTWLPLYGIDTASDERRRAFLAQVRERMETL